MATDHPNRMVFAPLAKPPNANHLLAMLTSMNWRPHLLNFINFMGRATKIQFKMNQIKEPLQHMKFISQRKQPQMTQEMMMIHVKSMQPNRNLCHLDTSRDSSLTA